MPAVARSLLLTLNIALLSSPAWFERWPAGRSLPYLITTALLLLSNAALVWWWDRTALDRNPDPGPTVQQLSASLNGTVIGTVTLRDGWQRVEQPAPGRAWQFGVNELTISLSGAVSPKELGLSDDGRRLSLAVDRLSLRTR